MSDRPVPELERQQALLQSLWRQQPDAALAPLLRPSPRQARGLAAYRANAGANAERALAAAYPVVQALIGEEAFAGLARACWQDCPPAQGDMARFAEVLPAFIETERRLAELPYLADVARLEALLAQAECAADSATPSQGFERLATDDPAELRLVLAPGFALLHSVHPVLSVWLAHQPGENADAWFETARHAMQTRRGDNALVWRQGWKAQVQALDNAAARWSALLREGVSLGEALLNAPEDFVFEPWLLQALQQGWVLGIESL